MKPKISLDNLTLQEKLNSLDDGTLNNSDLLYSILFELVEKNEKLEKKLQDLRNRVETLENCSPYRRYP